MFYFYLYFSKNNENLKTFSLQNYKFKIADQIRRIS